MVSIIIPNYNYARFLDKRILSILNQSYQDFEVIILDDKSTDNSVAIIEKYRNHPKVSNIIYNEINSGSPFIQWYKGIELAKGDYIWIAESDDSCEPSFLEKLMPSFDDKEVVVAFVRSYRQDENDHAVPFDYQDSLKENFILEGKDFIKKYLAYKNVICNASSAIFSKAAALQIDDKYKEFKGCGDWLFWISMVAQGKVAYINEPLNMFRLQGANTTQRILKSGLAKKEDKRVFDYLLNSHFIDNKQYQQIRESEIKKIYFSHSYDTSITNNLLDNWNVTCWERIKMKLTDCYIHFRS